MDKRLISKPGRRLPCRRRAWAFLLFLCAAWPGCAMSPETGRRQLLLVPEGQELAMGRQAYDDILGKATVLPDDHRLVRVVRRVGGRIAQVARKPRYQWQFNVIQSDQQNAFCLPGGRVAVYTGIIPVLQNEAALAAVMGHEVAHAVARHGGERMSQGLLFSLGGKALDVALQEKDPAVRKGILAAYGLGGTVGVMLPYSRKHELEADRLGLKYMAEAGYDPAEAVRLWQRFGRMKQGAAPPELLSTHPCEKRRIQRLQALLPQAQRLYGRAPRKLGLGEALQ